MTTAGELAALFERALDTDAARSRSPRPRGGATLRRSARPALPPGGSAALFRQGIVEGLADLSGEPLDWDVMEPLCRLRQRRGCRAADGRVPPRCATSAVPVGSGKAARARGGGPCPCTRGMSFTCSDSPDEGPPARVGAGPDRPSGSDEARTCRRADREGGHQNDQAVGAWAIARPTSGVDEGCRCARGEVHESPMPARQLGSAIVVVLGRAWSVLPRSLPCRHDTGALGPGRGVVVGRPGVVPVRHRRRKRWGRSCTGCGKRPGNGSSRPG